MKQSTEPTHSLAIGYLLWFFGFLGAHRFYFGKQLSATLYFFTCGLFLIGWLVDLFLMPNLNEQASIRYNSGRIDFSIAWVLLTFVGLFGIHRFYMGKWLTGCFYLLTLGLFGIGYIYDFWTLNEQISLLNGSETP